jgi:hypothetical protein
MKLIITILIVIFFTFGAKSQVKCDFIKLCSQSEVDSFPQKYKHCNEIFSIEIDDNCGWVYNLDSLESLITLGELRIQRMDSLTSISGLYNLKKIGRLRMVQRRYFEPFENLDSLIYLSHFFSYNQADLSLYANIKHIDSSISIINSGYLSGLHDYTCGDNFDMTVNQNKYTNEIKNIIPINCKNVKELVITRNENLSLKGIEQVDRISRVIIDSNKSCDYSALNINDTIERIQIGLEDYENNEYGVFDKITDLKYLSIYETENLKNINILFPNLKKITSFLILRANKHLVDIRILDSFDLPYLPLKEVFDPKQRIVISNNPFLADCASPYICKALQVYPDSVVINGNGPNCEKSELLSGCINSTIEEADSNEFSVYPNPTYDQMYWHSTKPVDKLEIINANGQVVLSVLPKESNVDISFLNPGVYYYRISGTNFSQIKKLVKM